MYKPKLILLFLFLITLVACGPNDDENIPVYQEAIYVMDSDGENKTKIIDVDECDNVQFIPNSNKLLYLADNSLYTVNLDGSENLKISGELNVRKDYSAVSELGTKIVFAVYSDQRDYIYDLYETNPDGSYLKNLTNTPNRSEKEVSFIYYNEQECLLYVSNFREDDIDFSTISLKYLNSDHQEKILYCKENTNNIEYGGGFRYPSYSNNSNRLIVNYGIQYDKLLSYEQLENGTEEILSSNNLCSISPIYHNQTNKLLFFNGKISLYDLTTMSNNDLVKGYDYSFSKDGNNILFAYSLNNITMNIAKIEIDSSEQSILTSGIKPRFNNKSTSICYIAQYVVNSRSLITF